MNSLNDLRIGESATVIAIENDGPVGLRMMEMGVAPGSRLRLVGIAPLGDPLEVELMGYRLSLRRDEARFVRIERTARSPVPDPT